MYVQYIYLIDTVYIHIEIDKIFIGFVLPVGSVILGPIGSVILLSEHYNCLD